MRYRRVYYKGGMYFFTVNLADRSSDLLTRRVDALCSAFRKVRDKHPFETVAMVVCQITCMRFGSYRTTMLTIQCGGV